MKIRLNSIFVDDQAKGLHFYTQVLGFEKKQDFPVGEYRWITVVSPEEPDGTQLVLEPNANPASKTYQQALFEQRIPATAFEVSDISAQYARLTKLGVSFQGEPRNAGPVTIAVLSDTCGNWIQLYQVG